jgi:hypothetical protein
MLPLPGEEDGGWQARRVDTRQKARVAFRVMEFMRAFPFLHSADQI